jgi:hypothetical protein
MLSDASLQLGKRLKKLRVENGLCQADVSERVGLSRGAVTVRDLGELLATLSVRVTRLPLPNNIHGLFRAESSTGILGCEMNSN